MTRSWVMDNNYVKYNPHQSDPWKVMANKTFLLCVNSDLDFESRSLHTIGSWKIIVWNIIQIQQGSKEFIQTYNGPTMISAKCALWPLPCMYTWPLAKVMAQPWVMDKDCVILYLDLQKLSSKGPTDMQLLGKYVCVYENDSQLWL